ncbi:hypothetical protein J437_LFUL012619 [Ladona fulva]|uniref:Mos1 transposase HTH domain-containing protein n=1 Tax=Ladona fulva TaxID=123851 RepID=A0A8K0KHN6_LADFU|nr:hypothetical protein J437_LFUL012619 [Ladona fulva]
MDRKRGWQSNGRCCLFWKACETPISTHRKLRQSYGTSCISAKTLRKWCVEFSEGRTEVHDEPRSGRPSLSDEVKGQIESAIHTVKQCGLTLCSVDAENVDWGWNMLPVTQKPFWISLVGSPDLVMSEFHLVLILEKHVGGRRMDKDEEVRKELTEYLEKKLTASFYAEGIKKNFECAIKNPSKSSNKSRLALNLFLNEASLALCTLSLPYRQPFIPPDFLGILPPPLTTFIYIPFPPRARTPHPIDLSKISQVPFSVPFSLPSTGSPRSDTRGIGNETLRYLQDPT